VGQRVTAPQMFRRRGGFLTAMAILLALTALQDALKSFRQQAPAPSPILPRIEPGIVFFGVRHTGTSATLLGPPTAAFLLVYAFGVWRMKRYAFAVAWIYAVYVAVNVTLFTIGNPPPPSTGAAIFAIAYAAIAIGLTWGTAIALTMRRASLA